MKGMLELIFGPRPPCKCGKKMYPIRRNVPIFVCVCGTLKVGTNTMSMSPGGTNVLRWSATQAALAAGDIGMDVGTGEPQAFVGGSSKPVLTTASLVQSVFSFTHTSGAASTGALGFTPRFAIYSGAVREASNTMQHIVGFAIGTGASAIAAGLAVDVASGSQVSSGEGDDDAIGGASVASGAFLTVFGKDLDVTAFGSGGITLTWSLALSATAAHAGKLLVVG